MRVGVRGYSAIESHDPPHPEPSPQRGEGARPPSGFGRVNGRRRLDRRASAVLFARDSMKARSAASAVAERVDVLGHVVVA